MNLPKKIFSIEIENLHKVFIIFGFKIKIFDRILAMKKDIDFLQKENSELLNKVIQIKKHSEQTDIEIAKIEPIQEKLKEIDIIKNDIKQIDIINEKLKEIDIIKNDIKQIDIINEKLKEIDIIKNDIKQIDVINEKLKENENITTKINKLKETIIKIQDELLQIKNEYTNSNNETIKYLISKLRNNNYDELCADYKYNGYSKRLHEKFKALAASKHNWLVENNNLWLLYLQVLLENKFNVEAYDIYTKYMHFHNLKNAENFPIVANYFVSQNTTNERISKSAQIYNKLEYAHNNKTFEKMIKNKNIAVVGNGSCEIGLEKGSEIDNHDIVIRFNEFYTNEHFAKDYGTKTDVWVNYSANKNFITYKKDFNYKLNLWLFDSLYFRDDIGVDNLYSMINKDWDIISIDTAKIIWNKLHYYYAPTSGFFLIVYLWMLRGSLHNIDFYGFKFLENEDTEKLHYFDDKDFSTVKFHNFEAESIFLKEFVEKWKNVHHEKGK